MSARGNYKEEGERQVRHEGIKRLSGLPPPYLQVKVAEGAAGGEGGPREGAHHAARLVQVTSGGLDPAALRLSRLLVGGRPVVGVGRPAHAPATKVAVVPIDAKEGA